MGVLMIDLKSALYEFVLDVLATAGLSAAVYEAGEVPAEAAFPYVTYRLGGSVEGAVDRPSAVQYPFELEVFDRSLIRDSAPVETLTDALDAGVDRQHILDDDFYVMFVRETREPNLPVEDEYTYRRLLRYAAQVFA